MGSTFRLAFHKPDEASGSPYPVRYDASNPSDAQVVTFTDFWQFPFGALGIGIVCLIFAANAWLEAAAQ